MNLMGFKFNFANASVNMLYKVDDGYGKISNLRTTDGMIHRCIAVSQYAR